MKRFLILTRRSPSFDEGVLPAHFEFLQLLREGGMLELAGGFADKTGGAYVLRATSLEAAQELTAQDPLVLTGASALSVHEWNA